MLEKHSIAVCCSASRFDGRMTGLIPMVEQSVAPLIPVMPGALHDMEAGSGCCRSGNARSIAGPCIAFLLFTDNSLTIRTPLSLGRALALRLK